MNRVKKILFPTDFSSAAGNAFRYALQLAEQLDAKIEVLNVVYPQGESLDYALMVVRATQTEVRRAKGFLNKFVQREIEKVDTLLAKLPRTKQSIEVGTPIQKITEKAIKDDTDLIIMGSRGESRPLVEKWLGSIAAGVVKKAPCPIMVIPEHSTFQPISVMAYASDTRDADPYELWKGTQLLEPFKPVIHCVHVQMSESEKAASLERLEMMKTFFTEHTPGLALHIHQLEGNRIEEKLNEFVEQYKVDILMMYQAHHGFWNRLFHKSVTGKMAVHSKVPLLVLPKVK